MQLNAAAVIVALALNFGAQESMIAAAVNIPEL
jgi:hypothetical protein